MMFTMYHTLPRRQRVKETKPSGGLEAALSQYSSSIGPAVSNSESNRIPRTHSGTLLFPSQGIPSHFHQDRPRAASPLFPTMNHLHERGSLATSPLLIPPMNQAQSSDPPDNLRHEESGALGFSRVTPLESRGFQGRDPHSSLGVMSNSSHGFQSRDGHSSLGLLSGSNHGEFGSGPIQPVVS